MDATMIDNATSTEELDQMLEGLQETSEPETEQPEEPEASPLEERLSALEKRLKDKESFINQRNAEIGLLRKQLRDREIAALDAEDTEPSAEELLDNPREVIQRAIERARKRDALQQEKQQESGQELLAQNRELIAKYVPDLDAAKPGMLEVLKADGAPQNLISQFEEDPASTFHAPVVYQMAKRAEAMKTISELEAKLAKYEEGANRLVGNAQKFKANKPTTQPAPKSRSSKALDGITEDMLDNMSLDELNELEKELLK